MRSLDCSRTLVSTARLFSFVWRETVGHCRGSRSEGTSRMNKGDAVFHIRKTIVLHDTAMDGSAELVALGALHRYSLGDRLLRSTLLADPAIDARPMIMVSWPSFTKTTQIRLHSVRLLRRRAPPSGEVERCRRAARDPHVRQLSRTIVAPNIRLSHTTHPTCRVLSCTQVRTAAVCRTI